MQGILSLPQPAGGVAGPTKNSFWPIINNQLLILNDYRGGEAKVAPPRYDHNDLWFLLIHYCR